MRSDEQLVQATLPIPIQHCHAAGRSEHAPDLLHHPMHPVPIHALQ